MPPGARSGKWFNTSWTAGKSLQSVYFVVNCQKLHVIPIEKYFIAYLVVQKGHMPFSSMFETVLLPIHHEQKDKGLPIGLQRLDQT